MKASEITPGVYLGKDGTQRQVVSANQELFNGKRHWFVNWYPHPIDHAKYGRSSQRTHFARWVKEKIGEDI